MATTTRTRSEVAETAVKSNGKSTRFGTARAVMTDAVTEAATVAGSIASEASTRLPVAATTTRDAFDDANRRIRGSSDEVLRMGTAASFAFVAGLLIAGANRILVAVALIPVAMIGIVMLERSTGTSVAGRSSGPGGL